MSRRGENIRKRKDGRWEGRYRVAEDCTGEIHWHSVYAKSYVEVKEKLFYAKVESTHDIPRSPTGSAMFVSDVAEEWLRTIEKKRKHSTYIKYRNVYNLYIAPHIGRLSIDQLEKEQLDAVTLSQESREQSISTQKSILGVLNQILKYISEKYRMPAYAVTAETAKAVKKPIEILSQSEQISLLRHLYSQQDVCAVGIILCMYTGLRLGEICALKWEDIDFSTHSLFVRRAVQRIAVENRATKTILLEGEPKSCFSKREIPLSEEIIDLLAPYRKQQGYLICNGKAMEPRTYQYKFAKYLRMAGIDKKNFHILRHTFATNCINSGMDIKSLSEILGHSDVRITLNRYVHPTMEVKRQHMESLANIYGQYVGKRCS